MKKKWILVTAAVVIVVISLLFLVGYKSSEITESEIKMTRYSPDSLVNYFGISKNYFVEWHDANSLTIHVEYPNMQPNVPNYNFSMDKAIRIYISGIRGGDEVKTFLSHVYSDSAKNCPTIICYARKIETTPKYDLIRYGTKDDYANKKGKAADYYLFEAYDGQKILIEDVGAWARSYKAQRHIDNFFIIQYQFPRKVVVHSNINEKIEHDFKVIDKTVTEFIKKQINFNKQ